MSTTRPTNDPGRRRFLRAGSVIAACALAVTLTACRATDDDATAGSSTVATPPTTVARPSRPLDELVAISTGHLHIRCHGQGAVTVLLIAGWDNGSETWNAVEPTLARSTRVCSYDRFGTGTSDPPTVAQTFETQVADLHELLDLVGEPGPYVVVGHSFGGAEAVTFSSTYPGEVAGLALVDASPVTWPATVCSVPAYAAGCELMRHPSRGERLDVFPAFAQVASISSLGDLPMTVMTAAHRSSNGITSDEVRRLEALWRRGTERWARMSSVSRIVTVEQTGHEIQVDQPSSVVVEVRKLLRAAGTAIGA